MRKYLHLTGMLTCSLSVVTGCSNDKKDMEPPVGWNRSAPNMISAGPPAGTAPATNSGGQSGKTGGAGASFVMVFGGSDTGLLLGSWRNGAWLDWKHTHESLKGGEPFAVYSLDAKDADYTGGKPELSQASGDAYSLKLSKEIGVKTTAMAIGGATWEPLIRKGEETRERKNGVMDDVKKILKEHGIDQPKVDITKIWTVDLDGTGASEILVEAKSLGFDNSMDGAPKPKKGDFTMVCLIQISGDGKGKVSLLGGEFLAKKPSESEQIYNKYTLASVLDLNGDGKLEVIVESSYYEGAGAAIWDISGGAPKKVLEAADGA